MEALRIVRNGSGNVHDQASLNLRDALVRGRKRSFADRTHGLSLLVAEQRRLRRNFFMREILTGTDREVLVRDPFSGSTRKMLMFGSNNYLGLAGHGYIKEAVCRAVRRYGAGLGGPPLLNGYTQLHRRLEERISAMKGAEDTLLFSSGYNANVGLMAAVPQKQDLILYDELSHASFYDGLKMAGTPSRSFAHNETIRLAELLNSPHDGDRFVAVEGVYSMDGDLAPLDEIVPLCRQTGAILILDDAHGTGVMGANGKGTAAHFDVEHQVDITMGTFSKAFACAGGFVSSSKPVIDYLRYFARSYVFSASMPPPALAAIHAGLDVMESEPERLDALKSNLDYLGDALAALGMESGTCTPIFTVRPPSGMDIREAAYDFHRAGIFVNAVEYPAVPVREERFRISLMATHRRDDLDRLVECIDRIWSGFRAR